MDDGFTTWNPNGSREMPTVHVTFSGMPQTQWSQSGRPLYWVAWVIDSNSAPLNFINNLPRLSANQPMDLTFEVPQEAARIIVGASRCGRLWVGNVRDCLVRSAPPVPVATPTPTPVPTPVSNEVKAQPLTDPKSVTLTDVYMLNYDIPTASGLQPQGRLRSRAIWLQGSLWAIKGADIPWRLVHTLQKAGSVVDLLPFDPKAGQQLINIAVREMRKKMDDQIARCREQAEEALCKLNADDEGAGDVMSRRKAYERAIKVINDRMAKLITDFQQVARRFGISEADLRIGEFQTGLSAIRQSMYRRGAVYTQGAVTARETGTDTGRALADAAERDELPAGILADYLEESGADVYDLRDAYREDGEEDSENS